MKALDQPNHLLHAWLRSMALLGIALTLSETFLVLGVVSPVAIEGSSMAPTALGPHLEAMCPHCQLAFAVGLDQRPASNRLVCPNCLQIFEVDEQLPLAAGQRVLVDRVHYEMFDAQRWDVVVFRCPEHPTDYCIKRVIGLPGEHVDFEKGDLVIDDQIVRKTLSEQLRLRQSVHVERDDLQAWFAPRDGWSYDHCTWTHQGPSTQLCFAPIGDLAVLNHLGVNQAAVLPRSIALDLMVTCQAKLGPQATLQFVAEFGEGTRLESSQVTDSRASESGVSLVWSLFDRQALLAVDGSQTVEQTRSTPWPGPPGLRIEAVGEVEITDLTVWRDIHYHTRPVDRWPAAGVQVSPQNLFVVGDNVAISSDSRTWASHQLPAKLLIGRPIGVE
ncbi:signal peptidase I [Aeoliella mucimassa]|uniref:Signal peptidase I n=1 Tax=Aeoliella mucimassa TaxID=2527972 RepID=A0A518AVK1_9BACT|nr:signal peptidase I [Aeoliella mucimassa]QDU58750.1 signal peptidase I [Aeoliella mucimassa]